MQIDSIPDFMSDVYDLLNYITGNAQIFRGNQSREVLPEDNDYLVYTPITQKRIGTNIVRLHADKVPDNENAPDTDTKLLQIDLQIDCYGAKAFGYAEGINTFAYAGRCNEWLIQNKKDIRVLYANDPFDATLVDDTHQYITRWTLMLSICLPISVTDMIPWIEEIPVYATPEQLIRGTHLKNIDVDFKEEE